MISVSSVQEYHTRKFMKKITSILVLSSILLSCLTMNISAEEKANENQFTQEELVWIDELKQINPEFNLEEGELVSISKKTTFTKDGSLSRGAIGSSYMTIYVTAIRLNSSNKDYDDFQFQMTAKWKQAPFFRMQDAVALDWSDEFTLYSSTCNAYYLSLGLVNGKTNKITSAPEKGVGYSVECSDWYGQSLDKVILTAKAKKYNDKGTANVAGAYAHATVAVGLGFSIDLSGTGSVGFATAGAHDTAANDKYFEY